MLAAPFLGQPTGALSLREVLAQALLKSPDLAAFSWEVRAGEARTLQASLLPNPELEVELEEFGGTNDFAGFDVVTSKYRLRQLIETGGKRAKRTRLAALERDLNAWDYEARRLDVLTEATKAFVDVLAAQEQVTLSTELVRLSEQSFETVSERVKAGKVSPLEETKSGVELANTRIQLEQARRTLQGARKRLAAVWGQQTATFGRAEGNLDALQPIPIADELQDLIARNPDVARWVKEMEQRSASLEVQNARRIPDVTLSGGVQRFNETEDTALLFTLSLPLPLFDCNQGGIREAQYKLVKGKKEQDAAVARASSGLAEAYQNLASFYAEGQGLKERVLPGAQEAFEASGIGYREGKFDFLECLDSQRTLFEARGKYIDALSGYHKAVADVERLIGQPLTGLSSSGETPHGN